MKFLRRNFFLALRSSATALPGDVFTGSRIQAYPPRAVQPEPIKDPLGRISPRASVLGF
jgi:hypothetical protein